MHNNYSGFLFSNNILETQIVILKYIFVSALENTEIFLLPSFIIGIDSFRYGTFLQKFLHIESSLKYK